MPPSDQEPRYQLVDSDGNVVGSLFGDGSGNVVIADETDTQTTFGPDGITTPALEATSVGITDTLIQSGLPYGISSSSVPDSNPTDTSSGSFTDIATLDGAVASTGSIPAGAELQANLVVRASSVPSGETGTYSARVLELDVGGGAAVERLEALNIDVTNTNIQTSGWQTVAEVLSDRYIRPQSLQAKVTSGTLSSYSKDNFALLFRVAVQ